MDNFEKKAICWLRGSTDQQEIQSQRSELTKIATEKEGFLEKNLIYIGKEGASAIKQNALYLAEVNELLETLKRDKSVKTVFVWEISRLARVELAFYKLKDYFVTNKIQLICQVPYIKMLDENGAINNASEITMSLLVTLARQEMDIKKERFRRGRERGKKEGRFNGGKYGTVYGYKIENRFIVEDAAESARVNEIFRLYATGKYSTYSLAKELQERGYTFRDGQKVTAHRVQCLLRDEAYLGEKKGRKFPAIVAKELWDKCYAIRKKNVILEVYKTRETQRICLGLKHLKCPVCGGNMIAQVRSYRCYRHVKQNSVENPCSCTEGIRIDAFDRLIWDVAQVEHLDNLQGINVDALLEYEEELEVVKQKLTETENRLKSVGDRKNRIMELYMNGDIDKTRYEYNKDKLAANITTYTAEIEKYNGEIQRLRETIENIKNPSIDAYVDLTLNIMNEQDKKKMKEIIDKYIGKCYVHKTKFTKREAFEVIINTQKAEHKFVYLSRSKKCFKFNASKNEWLPYGPLTEEERNRYGNDLTETMERLGTSVEEITKELQFEDFAARALSNPNLSEGEKKLLTEIFKSDSRVE